MPPFPEPVTVIVVEFAEAIAELSVVSPAVVFKNKLLPDVIPLKYTLQFAVSSVRLFMINSGSAPRPCPKELEFKLLTVAIEKPAV